MGYIPTPSDPPIPFDPDIHDGYCSCGNPGSWQSNQYQIEVNGAEPEECMELICNDCEYNERQNI